MMSDAKKRATLPWVPTGFCAILALITVGAQHWTTILNRSDSGAWSIGAVFLLNLPMCFYFVGAATSRMQREILELRQQVAQLQGNKAVI